MMTCQRQLIPRVGPLAKLVVVAIDPYRQDDLHELVVWISAVN